MSQIRQALVEQSAAVDFGPYDNRSRQMLRHLNKVAEFLKIGDLGLMSSENRCVSYKKKNHCTV